MKDYLIFAPYDCGTSGGSNDMQITQKLKTIEELRVLSQHIFTKPGLDTDQSPQWYKHILNTQSFEYEQN